MPVVWNDSSDQTSLLHGFLTELQFTLLKVQMSVSIIGDFFCSPAEVGKHLNTKISLQLI